MNAWQLADWFRAHGWTIEAVMPSVVTLSREGRKSTRAYIRLADGAWKLHARRGRRFYPGSRSDDEEVA